MEGLPLTLCFNPVLEHLTVDTILMQESCLSVPGLIGAVKRSSKVALTYEDEQGKKRRLLAEGFLAGLLQHEMDHLDGVLFVDRASKKMLAFDDEWWSNIQPRLQRDLCEAGKCLFD